MRGGGVGRGGGGGVLGGGRGGGATAAGRGGQLCKRLLHDGDETQKIVEALAEHDFSS